MTNVKTNNNGQFKLRMKLPFRCSMILLHHVLEKQWPQIHPKRNPVKFSAEENM